MGGYFACRETACAVPPVESAPGSGRLGAVVTMVAGLIAIVNVGLDLAMCTQGKTRLNKGNVN
jgi:hypothetical protein